jgi:adenylate cyclase
MEISKYSRKKIEEILAYSLSSAVIGIAFAIGLRFLLRHDGVQVSLLRFILLGGLTGGVLCATFMLIDPWLERLFAKPLWIVLAITPAVYASVICVEYGVLFSAIMGFDSLLKNSFIVETLFFSLAMSLAISFVGMVSRLLGRNVLSGFILGKYNRPVSEERFVMYLDIAGSTAIAERIGNIRFLSFLNDFFRDISRPIVDCHGDIHKYVGDEAIITWDKKDGMKKDAAIAAFFAVEDAIASREAHYEARYGVVPRFRAGLHYGEVIVGEMGDVKREIAILGDVMNTAARIQGECRALGESFLVSGEALALIETGLSGCVASFCGNVGLRGKEAKTALHAIKRATAK